MSLNPILVSGGWYLSNMHGWRQHNRAVPGFSFNSPVKFSTTTRPFSSLPSLNETCSRPERLMWVSRPVLWAVLKCVSQSPQQLLLSICVPVDDVTWLLWLSNANISWHCSQVATDDVIITVCYDTKLLPKVWLSLQCELTSTLLYVPLIVFAFIPSMS